MYSCSIPNHGSWSAYFSASSADLRRVFVLCGVMSGCSTSHMTSLSPSARRGSGQAKTGWSTQSESLPSAWFVLEPSKPQIGGSLPSSTIFVLLRSSGVGSVPSIQMYSAW